jgi:excinuclease ABC subunit C
MLPTTADVFTEFGPSKYLRRAAPGSLELTADYRAVRAQLRADCPQSPGVYGMIDCARRLVYVGKSRCLVKRTTTYFQKDAHAGLQPSRKEARIAARARQLVWESADHELLALLREQELIRRFGPEMNVRGRRRRRLVYVFLSVEDAPRFKVAARLPKSCRHYWGPVVRTGGLMRAVELLNRHFRIPDCPPEVGMHFGEQGCLFRLDLYPQCLRGQMNGCLAPCAGTVTRAEYRAQLRRARAFLDGRDDGPLRNLDCEIQQASKDRHFELAAMLHAKRSELAELRERLLPRPDLLPASFVYAYASGSRTNWLAVHEGLVMKTGRAPCSEPGRRTWQARFDAWREIRSPNVDEREGSELSIIAGWFRQNPEELAHVTDFETARQMCSC